MASEESQDVVPAAGTPLGDQARRRLTEDMTAWLTTVGKDGTPQPNPVWFLWDGAESLLVYNKTTANRLTHVKSRPRVSLHFNSNSQGSDILVLTGDAELLPEYPLSHENPDYLTKYEAAAIHIGGSVEKFSHDYPVALRIHLTKVRGF